MRNIRISDKQDQHLQQGESAMGIFFWGVFALLAVIWLCRDTSVGLTDSLNRYARTSAPVATGFWPLDSLLGWL